MSFEELGDILDRNNLFPSFCNSDRVKLALLFAEVFKIGEKSQQSKIDELQKRIDEAVIRLESIKADELRPSHHDYDKGWHDCAITVLNDLKGEK